MHFEFYPDGTLIDEKQFPSSGKKSASPSSGSGSTFSSASNVVHCIHVENLNRMQDKTSAEIMESLLAHYAVPVDKRVLLFTHVRLAHAFADFPRRLLCVQARLQALSILVYSNALQDNLNTLLYSGLIEELVDVLELKDPRLMVNDSTLYDSDRFGLILRKRHSCSSNFWWFLLVRSVIFPTSGCLFCSVISHTRPNLYVNHH